MEAKVWAKARITSSPSSETDRERQKEAVTILSLVCKLIVSRVEISVIRCIQTQFYDPERISRHPRHVPGNIYEQAQPMTRHSSLY